MGDIKVTQADRLKSAKTQLFYHRITQVSYDAIINGEWDDEECVLMEARHRIEAQRPLLEALEAIVDRSHNDPLGTSKVIDMRQLALDAIKQAKGE